MARVETIVVGGGINAQTPFTVNRIPYILQADPPYLTPSPILSQVIGANQAIVISPTAADPQAGTTTLLRVVGGIASFPAADANGLTNVVLGKGMTLANTMVNGTLIGNGISLPTPAGTAPVIVGNDVAITSGQVIVVGRGTTVGAGWGTGSIIAIGNAISIGAAGGGGSGTCVYIGDGIVQSGNGVATPGNNTIIGSGNTIGISTFGLMTVVGFGNNTNTSTRVNILGRSNTIAAGISKGHIFGSSNTVNHSDCIIIGESVTTTAANQCYIGGLAGGLSIGITTVIVGNGDTTGAPQPVTVRLTDGAGANIAAGNLTIRPGTSTGNATPSSIIFQTSTVGAAGAALQALSTRLTIDTNVTATGYVVGRFVGARVRNSANQSINSGVATALTFDTEDLDSDAFHDNVTNPSRLTIPAGLGGVYHISGGCLMAPNATGTRDIQIRINGATIIRDGRSTVNSAADGSFINAETIYNLAAGDYVELIVTQTSGGALNSVAIASYVPVFEIYRIST